MCYQPVSHPISSLQIHDPFPVEVQTCLQPVELEQVLLPLFLFPAHGWWSWVPLLLGEPCRGSWGVTLGTGLAPSPSATKGVLPIRWSLGLKHSLLPSLRDEVCKQTRLNLLP